MNLPALIPGMSSCSATLGEKLRTLPYGACLSPKLLSCGGGSHAFLGLSARSKCAPHVYWPSCLSSNGAAIPTPHKPQGLHTCTKGPPSSSQKVPSQASPQQAHLTSTKPSRNLVGGSLLGGRDQEVRGIQPLPAISSSHPGRKASTPPPVIAESSWLFLSSQLKGNQGTSGKERP